MILLHVAVIAQSPTDYRIVLHHVSMLSEWLSEFPAVRDSRVEDSETSDLLRPSNAAVPVETIW